MLKRLLHAVRHPISQNAIALYWVQIAQFLVPLVTIPYVARVLEPSAFGLVVLAQGLTFLLVLLIDWGLGYTGIRATAEHRQDPGDLSRIVQRVRGAQLLLAVASVPVALVALVAVPSMGDHPELLLLAWVAAVGTALTPSWFFVGIEKLRLISLVQLGFRVLGAALTFVLVRGPGDAWIVMALFSGAAVAGLLAADAMMYRRVRFRRPDLRASVAEIRGATTIFVGMVGATLYSSFNVVLLGLFASSADVAHFGAAERIVRVALSLLGPIGMAVFPRLIALQAAGSRERARRLLVLTVAIGIAPALLMTAAIALLAPTIIGVIYGERFVDAAVPILRVLVLIIPVGVTGVVFGTWLISQHRDRVSAGIVLGAGVVNVVLGCVLTLAIGPIGMACSVVAAEATAAAGAIVAVALRRGRPLEQVPAEPPPQPELAVADGR